MHNVIDALSQMKRMGRPYETAAARIGLLQNALENAQDELANSPETRATLQHELAIAYLEHSSIERAQQVEAAFITCQASLQVYTLAQYPHQYARAQITLGNIYRERVVGSQRDNLESALTCYAKAMQVFTLTAFPYEYALVQHGLGQTYQLRIEGDRLENMEQAIACCHQALSVRTLDMWPFEHAQTLQVLGTAYFRRVAGERRDNLEQAIACYRHATDIFTLEAFPVEYAQGQNYLAAAYSQRISGEQRDNLEQAIAYYRQALSVYTAETFPLEYAKVQNNLGIAYWQRISDERRNNLEQAIACYHEALRVWTLEAFPFQYAMLQNNLGAVYVFRVLGKRRDNLEQAIACYHEVLRVWTLEAFPYQYAKIQNNLGEAYYHRLAGERRNNLEQAIACYQQALRIWTLQALPQDYAMVQHNLGAAYQQRAGEADQENLNLALAAHREALGVYTFHAFPNEHRQVQLECAETHALRKDWAMVHEAYLSARKAEDLLVALGAGAIGHDAILKEGHDAAARDGFALTRLGKVEEAAVAIEGGRARGLAEAMQFNTVDAQRISNPERRSRFTEAHQAFISAQAVLQASLPKDLDEDDQRQLMLQHTAVYREAKAAFDAVVEEIHIAQDPADFFIDILDSAKIIEAVEHCGQGHTLVYLVATPWGGVAVAIHAQNAGTPTAAHFSALDLPTLTDERVSTLLETRLADDTDRITGGFDCAQRGNTIELLQAWPGITFREQAEALHNACIIWGHTGTLDEATQFVCSVPELTTLINAPLATLSDRNSALLQDTLSHAVLQRELQRCQALLGEGVLQLLKVWLNNMGVTSLTLVPCGPLAAFPLAGILLNDGQTLGESLPTSIAPSARSLVRKQHSSTTRTGVYTLGNPYPTRQALRWGEAEAFTLVDLGDRLGQKGGVKVQWQATRNWLTGALHTGYVVDASCHGIFDARDFLRSKLILAHEEELTLADILSYQSDLQGLRLLILSACQTAILDLQGARDEVRSLAAGMLQAGAAAVLAALWAVDDRATYLLIIRFAQEWFPHMYDEAPAAALARAQQWLRTVTNHELQTWQAAVPPQPKRIDKPVMAFEAHEGEYALVSPHQLVAVRGRANRFDALQAEEIIQAGVEEQGQNLHPYADPYYWAGFQITGW